MESSVGQDLLVSKNLLFVGLHGFSHPHQLVKTSADLSVNIVENALRWPDEPEGYQVWLALVLDDGSALGLVNLKQNCWPSPCSISMKIHSSGAWHKL